jgi:hypothetical protein
LPRAAVRQPSVELFSFVPLPWHLMLALIGIVGGYVLATEAAKASLLTCLVEIDTKR